MGEKLLQRGFFLQVFVERPFPEDVFQIVLKDHLLIDQDVCQLVQFVLVLLQDIDSALVLAFD